MKKLYVLIITVLITTGMQAQTRIDSIAIKACEFLEDAETYQALNDSLIPAIIKAKNSIGTYSPSSVESIRKEFKEITDALFDNCDKARDLYTISETDKFYKLSDDQKTNDLYEEGNDLMEAGDYKKAIKKYKKVLEKEPKFIYALDHIAICHRKLNEYDEALKYYKEALDIFPQGEIALLNSAVVYSLKKDYASAAKLYNLLKYWHPYNPEGYFGAGRMQIGQGDVDGCLDNLFTAHVIYVKTGNKYIEDSLKLLKAVYQDMEKRGTESLFFEKAAAYNINITQ